MQNFAATTGIALPLHRAKESMLPDLRNSLYQSTQPLLTQRSLLHQSVKPHPFPQPRDRKKIALSKKQSLNTKFPAHARRGVANKNNVCVRKKWIF
jgi:hypothetical protein